MFRPLGSNRDNNRRVLTRALTNILLLAIVRHRSCSMHCLLYVQIRVVEAQIQGTTYNNEYVGRAISVLIHHFFLFFLVLVFSQQKAACRL